MTRILMAIGCCVIFSQVAAAVSPEQPVSSSGSVYRVIDGDTFIVNLDDRRSYETLKRYAPSAKYFNDRYQSIRVRLASTDSDELGTVSGDRVAEIVRSRLEREGVMVLCYDYGENHRPICNVGHRGSDIGLWLIEQGWSNYVTYFGTNPFMHSQYRSAAR